MRRHTKKIVWHIYCRLWKTWDNKEPNPQVSSCKIGGEIIFIFVALAIVFTVLTLVGGIAHSILWFLGFSPNSKWYAHCDTKKMTFLISCDGNQYKINKRIAPWEVALFPISLTIWLLTRKPVRPVFQYTASWTSWMVNEGKKLHCPILLDFTDVIDQKKQGVEKFP